MLHQLYKRHLIRTGLSLLILLVFLLHVGGHYRIDALDQLELFTYDQRVKLTTLGGVDSRIVIVDIDEKSLAAEGRWPWSRNKLAMLLEHLFEKYGVAVVGFDVVFAEPDETSGFKVLKGLAEYEFKDMPSFGAAVDGLEHELNYDQIFADAIARYPVILGFTFTNSTTTGVLPKPVFFQNEFKGRGISFFGLDGFTANMAKFQNVALGAGHFTHSIDGDGVVRKIPMLHAYGEELHESLSLAIARAVLNVENILPGYAEVGGVGGKEYSGVEWLGLGARRIPVDEHARTFVPYRGRQGSFPYVSATDVLNGKVLQADLTGRIILVGTSAPGLLDLRATPVQSVYPGVEIHANMIAGIIDGNIKPNPSYALGAEFFMVVASGLLLVFLLPLLSPFWGTIATMFLLSLVIIVNLIIWQNGNLVLPLASVLALIFVMYLFSTTYALFVETRVKRQLAGLFGQYVPPELVDEMSGDPESFSLEGESRALTVLFSDVRDFTTISEGLDPQELSQLMNEYLTPMTRIIHEHRGTIDKYMGDAIMAFWGAPVGDSNHAHNAVEASIAMLSQLKKLQIDFKERGWPPIRIGIGLNTGDMNVGNMGSEFRMAYTVLGDAVNLGARLEGLTKGYGVDLIVSESTARAVPDLLYRELDRVRVKGKDKPVTIYEPIGRHKNINNAVREEIRIYQQALYHYRQQNWSRAKQEFAALQQLNPQKVLYKIYSERVDVYRDDPPPMPWDGVFTFDTK